MKEVDVIEARRMNGRMRWKMASFVTNDHYNNVTIVSMQAV